MKRRPLPLAVPLAAAAIAGAVVAVAVRGTAPAPAAAAPPPVSTAVVVRTDLSSTVPTAGTLGYAPTYPLVNQVTGTYTGLPAAGTTITPGRALYEVDDVPVVLMTGRTPAWRQFASGMTDGPDIRQLQANLIAEGYAAGLLRVPTGQFDWRTAAAVARWQTGHGYLASGAIPLGQVVFLPSAVRVGAPGVAPGQDAAPGQEPYVATTSQRVVTVPLNPDLPPVQVGEAVSIRLPTNVTTPGTVIATGETSAARPGSAGPAAAQLVVAPGQPGATGTAAGVPVQVDLPAQSVRAVLAVPVAALLALLGGGYALEVISRSGVHHLTGVTTGIYAGGRVQVSGPGIAPGTRVVTAP